MAFTGKATYSAGTNLPELAEDVADLIGIISPFETPLLDALGDPMRAATSTHHEWLEDSLLPNKDAINDSTYTDPAADTSVCRRQRRAVQSGRSDSGRRFGRADAGDGYQHRYADGGSRLCRHDSRGFGQRSGNQYPRQRRARRGG